MTTLLTERPAPAIPEPETDSPIQPVRMACGPPCNGNGGWWISKDGMPQQWIACPNCKQE